MFLIAWQPSLPPSPPKKAGRGILFFSVYFFTIKHNKTSLEKDGSHSFADSTQDYYSNEWRTSYLKLDILDCLITQTKLKSKVLASQTSAIFSLLNFVNLTLINCFSIHTIRVQNLYLGQKLNRVHYYKRVPTMSILRETTALVINWVGSSSRETIHMTFYYCSGSVIFSLISKPLFCLIFLKQLLLIWFP